MIIREARAIHVKWIAFLEKDPTGGPAEAPVVTAGDAAHHQRWVDKYDVGLRA